MRWCFNTLLMSFCIYLGAVCYGAERVVYLTSLEWPPYVGVHLPEQGGVSLRMRSAFARAGYRVEIRFLPWKRAVAMVQHQTLYSGFFPEYASVQRAQEFHCSDPILETPLALVQDANRPSIHWLHLADLAGYRIGTVAGYLNTPEFDSLAAAQALTTESTQTDLSNLKKVVRGRLDLAVIDPAVYHYLLRHEPELRALSSRLQLVPQRLGQMQLVACFRHNREGAALRDALNRGLQLLEP
jgi:polar amino acid transport system substrate-binding protein